MTENDIMSLHALKAAEINLEKAANAIERAGLYHLIDHIESIISDIHFECRNVIETGPIVEYKK